MNFRDMLNEMPVAVLGDWDNKIIKSITITRKVIEKNWKHLDTTSYNSHKLEVYTMESHDIYMLGAWGYEELDGIKKDVFIVITQGNLAKRRDLTSQFKEFKNVYQMKKISTEPPFRGKGYASFLYMYLIYNGMEIVSDMVQYDGARATYSKLSRLPSIKAYIIDAYEKEIIKKDTIVKQGFDDWDFDEEVWSYDFKKSNILIVLKAK